MANWCKSQDHDPKSKLGRIACVPIFSKRIRLRLTFVEMAPTGNTRSGLIPVGFHFQRLWETYFKLLENYSGRKR